MKVLLPKGQVNLAWSHPYISRAMDGAICQKMLQPLGRLTSKVELGSRLVLSFLLGNVPVNSQEMWAAMILR